MRDTAVSGERRALLQWPKTWTFEPDGYVIRYINHVKLVIGVDGRVSAKAYLVVRTDPRGELVLEPADCLTRLDAAV